MPSSAPLPQPASNERLKDTARMGPGLGRVWRAVASHFGIAQPRRPRATDLPESFAKTRSTIAANAGVSAAPRPRADIHRDRAPRQRRSPRILVLGPCRSICGHQDGSARLVSQPLQPKDGFHISNINLSARQGKTSRSNSFTAGHTRCLTPSIFRFFPDGTRRSNP